MGNFKLDTSGYVLQESEHYVDSGPCAVTWDRLSLLVQGYVEALLQTLEQNEWWDGDLVTVFPAFSDLAPETLARIINDCEWFEQLLPGEYNSDELLKGIGRSFYECRQGIGHFERSLAADREALCTLALMWEKITISLNPQGKVIFS